MSCTTQRADAPGADGRLPGLLDTCARELCPVSRLIKDDLPTLERPITANSWRSALGHCSTCTSRTKCLPVLCWRVSCSCSAQTCIAAQRNSGTSCLLHARAGRQPARLDAGLDVARRLDAAVADGRWVEARKVRVCSGCRWGSCCCQLGCHSLCALEARPGRRCSLSRAWGRPGDCRKPSGAQLRGRRSVCSQQPLQQEHQRIAGWCCLSASC